MRAYSCVMHAPGRGSRLAREKSPYLLQHAGNPVDWYPWGDEAFARALAEDKPVFLSIGYATCHWCHVMERESFMHAGVAAALNADFVCIKVDREERPDVDHLYMTAMQAMGMGGGWPLNVFLAPGRRPFWGGTYFPPSTTRGRTGLLELLPRIAEAWRTQREQVQGTGEQIMALLDSMGSPTHEPQPVAELAARTVAFLEREHDDACGGFGGAPKFPSPGNLTFLLQRWALGADGAETARRMVLTQLEAMRANGLHDHLGGGFHRYATDREWRIPHFEKMLYDQALLADVYLDAFRATGDSRWAETARGVFAYVERDLTSPEGAFRSAEDADSEGEEGRFYAWTPAELADALGPDDAALFAFHHGVTSHGNFEHGTTVLHEAHAAPDAVTAARLVTLRERLRGVREARPRPLCDDKILVAWNGLMIAALAKGARVLHEPAFAERASRAAEFVWTQLRSADGTLWRRWREGEAAHAAQLDDHADLALGLLELFVTTQEPRWLERAGVIVERMIAGFWDASAGAFHDAAAQRDGLPRLRTGFDGAELAPNSVAAEVLWRMANLCGRDDWRAHAERVFAYHARRLAPAPWAMPRMLAVMERAGVALRHVTIVGELDDPQVRSMFEAVVARLRPDVEVVVVQRDTREALQRLVPLATMLPERVERALAVVCVGQTCQAPVHETSALVAALET